MDEKLKQQIIDAVQSENAQELNLIIEMFKDAGNDYPSIFSVFKMACPWIDTADYKRLIGIAEKGVSR
ncbi:MAG: hypothetical protein GY841_15795 [FCB group bacterium]|nr:hypothetical protein [FCB group bacterium]